MIKIISAIDFSKCSLHALEYAINLANMVEADVIMVWVDTSVNIDADLTVINRESRMEIKTQFDELVSKYSPMLNRGKLSYKLRKGKVYQEISNQAKADDASMIITGSHGVSGYEKYWIGSNAFRIVSCAPCPVITVRLAYEYKPRINKIVLPIDSSPETRQKAPLTVRIAKLFNSEIHIVTVHSTTLKTLHRRVDLAAEETAHFISSHGVPVKTEILQSENPAQSIIHYAESIDADLISIMTEQGSQVSSVLLGPYAQLMVNNSPIPMLTIQSKELIMTKSS